MRRIPSLCLVCAALAVLGACQPRIPLTRIEASAAARNWCFHEGLAWGDPVEISEPAGSDAKGRQWYTVRFAAAKGEQRVMQVDAYSGWVKRVP